MYYSFKAYKDNKFVWKGTIYSTDEKKVKQNLIDAHGDEYEYRNIKAI